MPPVSASSETVIRQHVLYACAAGLVPIPVADFIAVSAVQLDLIQQLCTVHGVTYLEAQGKVLVGALTGGAIARMGASALKAIPGIGSIIGGVSMSIASGASTYAVGQVVERHLAAGGTLSNFDTDEARRAYADEYEEGKKVAKASADKPATKTVAARLEQLVQLKEKGLVSEAEYEAKRAKLLAEL